MIGIDDQTPLGDTSEHSDVLEHPQYDPDGFRRSGVHARGDR